MSRTSYRSPREGGRSVSVLMPVHDGERFLAEQVETILAQTETIDRLLVLDDVSSDRSLDLLSRMQKNDERLDIRQRSGVSAGVVATVRELLAEVETDYFALADQDDLWYPHKLKDSLDRLESTGAAMVYSDVSLIDETGELRSESYLSSRRIRPIEGTDPYAFLVQSPIVGHTIVGRREVAVLATTLRHDVVHHEALLVAAACASSGIAYCGGALGSYRQHQSNAVGARADSRWGRARRILDARHLRGRLASRRGALGAISELHRDVAVVERAYAAAVSGSLRGVSTVAARLARMTQSVPLSARLLELFMFVAGAIAFSVEQRRGVAEGSD